VISRSLIINVKIEDLFTIYFMDKYLLKQFCDNCKTVNHEQYEPSNSLLLDLSMFQKNKSITLEECLQWFLSERQINSNDKVTC